MSSATLEAPTVVAETPDDPAEPVYELVDGEKIEKDMSLLSQLVGSEIAFRFRIFVEEDGYVVTEPWVACFEWAPKNRRRPDVAYWRAGQYPDGIPARGDAAVPPAMIVEVVSPNDLIEDVDARLRDYFRAGVELAWIVYPTSRTVRTEQPDGTAHVYHDGDTIIATPVLSGFEGAGGQAVSEVDAARGAGFRYLKIVLQRLHR